jgi:hypothetical protein
LNELPPSVELIYPRVTEVGDKDVAGIGIGGDARRIIDTSRPSAFLTIFWYLPERFRQGSLADRRTYNQEHTAKTKQ